MGYHTERLIAESPAFLGSIEMALTKVVNDRLNDANADIKAMARAVQKDIPGYAKEMTKVLVLAGEDLDSANASLEAAILANIDWLKARTGNG